MISIPVLILFCLGKNYIVWLCTFIIIKLQFGNIFFYLLCLCHGITKATKNAGIYNFVAAVA